MIWRLAEDAALLACADSRFPSIFPRIFRAKKDPTTSCFGPYVGKRLSQKDDRGFIIHAPHPSFVVTVFSRPMKQASKQKKIRLVTRNFLVKSREFSDLASILKLT